jgi:hypothetical protein
MGFRLAEKGSFDQSDELLDVELAEAGRTISLDRLPEEKGGEEEGGGETNLERTVF